MKMLLVFALGLTSFAYAQSGCLINSNVYEVNDRDECRRIMIDLINKKQRKFEIGFIPFYSQNLKLLNREKKLKNYHHAIEFENDYYDLDYVINKPNDFPGMTFAEFDNLSHNMSLLYFKGNIDEVNLTNSGAATKVIHLLSEGFKVEASTLRDMVNEGVDINALQVIPGLNHVFPSPLTVALLRLSEGKIEKEWIETYLSLGANPNQIDSSTGMTVIQYYLSTMKADLDILKTLVKYGGKISACKSCGFLTRGTTPYTLVAYNKKIKTEDIIPIFEYFESLGINPNVIVEESTLLERALRKPKLRDIVVIRALLSLKTIEVKNARFFKGMTSYLDIVMDGLPATQEFIIPLVAMGVEVARHASYMGVQVKSYDIPYFRAKKHKLEQVYLDVLRPQTCLLKLNKIDDEKLQGKVTSFLSAHKGYHVDWIGRDPQLWTKYDSSFIFKHRWVSPEIFSGDHTLELTFSKQGHQYSVELYDRSTDKTHVASEEIKNIFTDKKSLNKILGDIPNCKYAY